jgi:hypothetical protein
MNIPKAATLILNFPKSSPLKVSKKCPEAKKRFQAM